MSKFQLISGLARQGAQDIVKNVDSWKQFLSTASRLYKYKFGDQLLIYLQVPDATACASLELWNERMRRWIIKGSKGIALIRDDGRIRPHLTYVFDVGDTRPVRGARKPYLWKMEKERHAPVVEALKIKYGEIEAQDLGGVLMETAAKAVAEAYGEYYEDLLRYRGGRFRKKFEKTNMEECFRDTMKASIQYMLLVRCGLDVEHYMDDEKLKGITEFSVPAALYHLGSAVSTVSMEILQEIGRVMRRLDREKAEEKKRQEKEEKALENQQDIGYSKDNKEFNALKRKSKEGSRDDERTDLYEERGLSDTGADDGRRGRDRGGSDGQIRDASAELPEGTPQRHLHGDAADRGTDRPSSGDRQAQEWVDREVAERMKQRGIDEKLKAKDQMAWVQAVNSLTAQAEEAVLREIVYS